MTSQKPVNNCSALFRVLTRGLFVAGVGGLILAQVGCRSGPPKPPTGAPLVLEIKAVGSTTQVTIPVYVAPYSRIYFIRKPDTEVLEKAKGILSASGGTDADEVERFLVTHEDMVIDLIKEKQKWAVWKKTYRANHILVIADFPPSSGVEAGRSCAVIPLDGRKKATVEIRDSGVHLNE